MLPDVVRQESAVAALVAAIRGPAAQLASDEALRTVLAGTGVPRGGPSEMALVGQRARFELYRELVHGRFRGALEVSIPHSLGRIAPARLGGTLEAFIEERASRSPYLRDVAREFVEWAMPLWRAQRDLPPYLGDLARFELLSFEVGAGPDDSGQSGSRVAADSPIDVQVAARLEHFDYAVHLLANDEVVDPSRNAEPRGCWVLAYRDTSHRTRYLELTEFGATLLAQLREGENLGTAVAQACLVAGRPRDDEALADAAMLLDDLDQRGVVRS